MSTSVVESVTRAGLCTGCGVCESLATDGRIEIRESPLGYLRPVVSASSKPGEEEQLIAAICPGLRVAHEEHPLSYDANWGPLVSTEVGHATDTAVRHRGSSGGVLSGLCIYLLETKKVDFVAQIAVSPSDPVKNELQLSRTREDVLRAAGSRYGPSAPLRKLRKLLATRERFAFVGKPCDAVALRAFIRMFPEVRPQIPYVLSFMCAGIPSLHGTREVVEEMGGEYSSLVSFKYRGDGWPGKAVACMRNGARYEMDYNTSWGRILGKHLQFRCKICADGIGEQADVVCGDAWYGKEGYPDFTEREGRSLILSRTVIGKSLIDQAYEVGVIEKQTLDISELAQMQPYQLERKRLALARNIATWLAKGRTTRYIGLHLRQCAAQVSIVKNLRNAWGTYKRCQSEPASDDSISN